MLVFYLLLILLVSLQSAVLSEPITSESQVQVSVKSHHLIKGNPDNSNENSAKTSSQTTLKRNQVLAKNVLQSQNHHFSAKIRHKRSVISLLGTLLTIPLHVHDGWGWEFPTSTLLKLLLLKSAGIGTVTGVAVGTGVGGIAGVAGIAGKVAARKLPRIIRRLRHDATLRLFLDIARKEAIHKSHTLAKTLWHGLDGLYEGLYSSQSKYSTDSKTSYQTVSLKVHDHHTTDVHRHDTPALKSSQASHPSSLDTAESIAHQQTSLPKPQ